VEKCYSWEATSASQAVSQIFETWRFITAYTRARHLSLSRVRWILSTPSYPIYWRLVLILISHLRLGLSRGFFPSGFITETLYAFIFSPTRVACTAHFVSHAPITRMIFDESSSHAAASIFLSRSKCPPPILLPPEHPLCQRPRTLFVFPQREAAEMRH